MRLWLFSYDISDNRRRRRTACVLQTQLERVQESVLAAQASALIAAVQCELNLKEDQFRAWPLAQREPGRQRVHGLQNRINPSPNQWVV